MDMINIIDWVVAQCVKKAGSLQILEIKLKNKNKGT